MPERKVMTEPVATGTLVTVYTVGGFGASTLRGKVESLVKDRKGGGLVAASGSSERSRYGTFDQRYVTDFNKFMNAYLDKTVPAIVIDRREVDGETEPTIDDF